MKKFYFIILFIFYNQFVYTQNNLSKKRIDSILTNINYTKLFNNEGFAKLTELYYQAKEIDYTEAQISILRRIIDIEAGSLKDAKAYDHILELKSLSLSIRDYGGYISACNMESKILFYDKNYAQAKAVLRDAKTYLSKIDNIHERAKSKTEINIYWWWIIEKSKLPKDSYRDSLVSIAKGICKDAVLIKDDRSRANRILFAANYAATTLVELNRMTEGEKYLILAKKQIKYVGKETFPAADFYAAKGDFEMANRLKNKNYLDSALSNYNQALKIAEEINYSWLSREKLYPKIAQVYKEKKDFEKQLLFVEKGAEIKDNHEKQENYNLNAVKQKMYKAKDRTDLEYSYKFIYLGSLGIIALLACVWIYKRFQISKNKEIDTSDQLISYQSGQTKVESINVTDLLKLLERDDDSFLSSFLYVYPSFGEKLMKIGKTMKTSDIEFCAMIKMNLDTKQIAQIKQTSVKSVESKKYRIRKKLNISPEADINVWMSKL